MMPTNQIGWKFLYSRRWLGYFAMLLVFSIACVWLGNWQFERRAQARAEIERIDSNYEASPLPLSEAMTDPHSFDVDKSKWQPVELHGSYLGDTILARNRPGPNGVGSNLIQAFRNNDGSIIFIDRGWVPVSGTDEIPQDLPRPAAGSIEVTARLLASEAQISGRTSTLSSVASIHIPELVELAGLDGTVYTAAYGQLMSEQPASETGSLASKPERDEGPHLSYALQWYVFILIAAAGMAYAARQEYRGLNAGSDSVKREDERRAARKRRRGPSDADEEDALLNG